MKGERLESENPGLWVQPEQSLGGLPASWCRKERQREGQSREEGHLLLSPESPARVHVLALSPVALGGQVREA